METVPIALFVYNRPTHTRRVVESLLDDQLSRNSELHVFADGAKAPSAVEAVRQVREYVRGLNGFKSVTLHERERNLGLANSLIEGITHICNTYGRVIVLEDDIIVSPYFLDYMNSALNHYENNETVMHISGYMFPVRDPASLPETFFYRATSCWGWATWARAWHRFEPDGAKLLDQIVRQGRQRDFDILGTMAYTRMLREQTDGKIDSWAIRWYASLFLSGGLCLHPAKSLVRNIGHDGSGTHCDQSTDYEPILADKRISRFPKEVVESRVAVEAIAEFYRSLKKPLHQRVMRLAKKALTHR